MRNFDDFSFLFFFFFFFFLIIGVLGMNEFYDLCLSVLYRLSKRIYGGCKGNI